MLYYSIKDCLYIVNLLVLTSRWRTKETATGVPEPARGKSRTISHREKIFRRDGRNFGTFLSMMDGGEDHGE